MSPGETGSHWPLINRITLNVSDLLPAVAQMPWPWNAPDHDNASLQVQPVRDTACFIALLRFLLSNGAAR